MLKIYIKAQKHTRFHPFSASFYPHYIIIVKGPLDMNNYDINIISSTQLTLTLSLIGVVNFGMGISAGTKCTGKTVCVVVMFLILLYWNSKISQ